jgi:hypothetical protein
LQLLVTVTVTVTVAVAVVVAVSSCQLRKFLGALSGLGFAIFEGSSSYKGEHSYVLGFFILMVMYLLARFLLKKRCWVFSQGWVSQGKNIVSTMHGYLSMILLFPLQFLFELRFSVCNYSMITVALNSV